VPYLWTSRFIEKVAHPKPSVIFELQRARLTSQRDAGREVTLLTNSESIGNVTIKFESDQTYHGFLDCLVHAQNLLQSPSWKPFESLYAILSEVFEAKKKKSSPQALKKAKRADLSTGFFQKLVRSSSSSQLGAQTFRAAAKLSTCDVISDPYGLPNQSLRMPTPFHSIRRATIHLERPSGSKAC